MAYTKCWKSYEEQLELLESRGMTVADRQNALDYLKRIGYYRLSGYWFAFRERGECCTLDERGKKPKKVHIKSIVLDKFRQGATFQNAKDLYVFDKKLRKVCTTTADAAVVGLTF